MKQSQRIVKNVFASGLAVGLGGLIQLAAVAYVARSVGVRQFGVYSFILAFAMFFQQLADLGLCNILIRELARKPEKLLEILGAALSLIWVLTIVMGGAMAVVVPFLNFPFETKLLTLLMGVSTLSQFHAMGYGSVLRAKEENELHAVGFFLHKVIFFVLIVVSLRCGMALLGVVVAHLIPNLFQWGLYRWIVARRYGHPRMVKDVGMWKYLLTHSLPVGGAAGLRLLWQQVDVFILTWMRDLQAVGLFSGPYRIAMALRFIPQTMSLPLYPMFSRLAHGADGHGHVQMAYVRSVKFFLVMGLPVTILFAGFSHVLIAVLLGPKYREASVAMEWMGLAFLPFFVSDPLPFLLTALDEQRFLLWSTITAMSMRAGLNIALIPTLGFVGPCVAFFAGEVLLLGLMVWWLGRKGYALPLWNTGWKPVVAAGLMMLVIWPCRALPVGLACAAGVGALAVYGVALWRLGAFSAEEIELAREGSRFLKPLLEKWTRHPQHTAV
jgi:O-antigen/teichoic acid export membrane protein